MGEVLKFESYSRRRVGIIDIFEINEITDDFEKLDALDNLERTACAKKRATSDHRRTPHVF